MENQYISKKDLDIYRMRTQGRTLRAIGEFFGVGPESMRQRYVRTQRRLLNLEHTRPDACREKGPCAACEELFAGSCSHNVDLTKPDIELLTKAILSSLPEAVPKTLIVSNRDHSSYYFPASLPYFEYAHMKTRLRALFEQRLTDGPHCFIVMEPSQAFSFIAAEIVSELRAVYPDIMIYLLFRHKSDATDFKAHRYPPEKYPGDDLDAAFDLILANSTLLGFRWYMDSEKELTARLLPICEGMLYYAPTHLEVANQFFVNLSQRLHVWSYNTYALFFPPPRAVGNWNFDKIDKTRTCFIAGEKKQSLGIGRKLDQLDMVRVQELIGPLDAALLEIAAQGYDTFIFGFDNGYGLLCATELIKLRYTQEALQHARLVCCPTSPIFGYTSIMRRECEYIPLDENEWRSNALTHAGLILSYSTGQEKRLQALLDDAAALGIPVRNMAKEALL